MKTISSHTFKHTLRDIHKNTENRKFCFILGAGTSRKSGIPTGGELAIKWFSEIKERLNAEELKSWRKEQKITETDLASSYGSIYRKRFENDKTSGYEFLVQTMKSATPSFGHIVMAQILTRTPGHCVLTTNFDSLVESSVYQFTNKSPLVCGHESLSGYARPSQTHPLIIKIHRDLLLAPKNDPDEINQLDAGWKQPLDHIFSTHIPIVIGYGGNDGSLMSYFENMNKPSNFFWCFRNESDITPRINKLITKHEGSFVKVTGFDELMYELLWVFDEIKPVKDELNEITNQRIQIATGQLNELTPSKTKEKGEEFVAIHEIKELSALEYSTLAENESNFEKRKKIYLQALEKYPTTNWLWWKFTYFLQFEKEDYSNLEEYYEKALKLNNDGDFIGNYALFLSDIKKDYKNAEKQYLKAISMGSNSEYLYVNYANFLFEIKKENEEAEKIYLKVINSNPENAYSYFKYALFLKESKKDSVNAEKYYLKALALDPEYCDANINYAQILLEKGEFEEADKYISKALSHSNIATKDALIESWFYRYAHYPKFLLEAETKIEELLSKNARSIDWNFEENISVAIKNGHPNPEKLKEFAKRISSQ
ncbi:tetratricopeptide repeat protein [Mucilaginibacter sp. 3215]|uniref:tetratricopeptide repeat protein n=1 Tax=Mucilaginibacter sp. 3215 TaxID=3373912 RepID=UPI003D1B8DBC